MFDVKREYIKLDDNGDFVVQDRKVYAWSESNCNYEVAWWLYEGVTDGPLLQSLRKERMLKMPQLKAMAS